MIVLNLTLDGIYGFNDFMINFTYPKKIVNSIVERESLAGRERFRYKKAVVLMGANATGKTSLGKALLRIFSYMKNGTPTPLYEMLSGEKGSFCIDFVNGYYCAKGDTKNPISVIVWKEPRGGWWPALIL